MDVDVTARLLQLHEPRRQNFTAFKQFTAVDEIQRRLQYNNRVCLELLGFVDDV